MYTDEELKILNRLAIIENKQFTNSELILLIRCLSELVIPDDQVFEMFLEDAKHTILGRNDIQ